MDVTIEQSCPSCGASIVLREDDRLIECAFCGVHNYRIAGAASRYMLPAALPAGVEEKQLIYVPYLRFKGSIFYVRDKEVQHKIVDTTRLGLDSTLFPASLGLRPQAMRIRPVVSATPGRFLLQSIASKTVFAQAAMVIDLFQGRGDRRTHHQAFIGETLSRIYQPCYVQDEQLHDAVTRRVVGQRAHVDKLLQQTCASKVAWEPQCITTLCPGCGGLLDGERDSLVLQCTNCQSLWQEQQQKFVPLPWQVVASEERRARYLPFWRITFSAPGSGLKSFGDYLRFTNQPLIVLEKYDRQPLAFWIPAFKLNPKAFLQLAGQLTVAQMRIAEGQSRPVRNPYPVTLEQAEAVQAIKTVLASTTLSKEKRFPLLPKLLLEKCRGELVYLPFVGQTHDLVQEHTRATLQTAALRYGRAL
ncbi:hypothetical protein [Desulfocastanea catecholica]